MKDFSIFNLSSDTITLYMNCFAENGSPKKKENIEWQFFNNPANGAFVDIAFDTENNKTAAIYAVTSIPFKINESKYMGTQSLDTITDISYRGKGLFITLAKEVYANAKNSGAALVYGFPNGNSVHGFQKKLAWEILDPVPFLIKPLKSKYFTNKIKILRFLPNINIPSFNYKQKKDFNIDFDNRFPDEVNELWRGFSKDILVAVIRNKAYLEWRYILKPNENYQIAHCYGKDNEYLGFVVFTIKSKHDGKIAYIMELIYDTNNPEAGRQLLNFAIKAIKEQSADCILSWCMTHSPNYKAFKTFSFMYMPEKLRPIELHFGASAFNDELKTLINNRLNWYISYSDSDTV